MVADRLARIRKVQAASGVAFAVFLGLHLATTASASLGVYDTTLRALRRVYRPIVAVEVLLVAVPAIVHVVCAVVVLWLRRRHGVRAAPALRARVHRFSGYFLLVVIAGHVFATRIVPARGTGPADLSYLAYSVLAFPAFIGPYYVALGIAGALHLFLGLPIALTVLVPRAVDARRLVRIGVAVAALAAIVVTIGVVSILRAAPDADRARFDEIESLYDRFLPGFPAPAR